MLSIIVAKSKNNVIGYKNKLVWNLAEDMKRFKEITEGHTVIMGRKTYESIGKTLENRENIVITHDVDLKIEGAKIVNNIEDLNDFIDDEEEHFVIGGAIIYRLLMPKVKKMYITQIDKVFEGDAYFPVINNDEWEITSKEEAVTEDGLKYEFLIYERK